MISGDKIYMIMMMMMMMMIIMVMMMMTMMMMRPRGLLNCQVQGLVPRLTLKGESGDKMMIIIIIIMSHFI